MSQNAPSTESYKGMRDFYPSDMAKIQYIFDIWEKTAREFGYQKMMGPMIEPSELYASKTSEEIVNEQTYTFTDRGERLVTLRPEMTPTVARMIAKKRREIPLPARWFSIGSMFRYERPQKGRFREHFQLNADIFGIKDNWAEREIIILADKIMKAFGASSSQYEIRINDRKSILKTLSDLDLDENATKNLLRLVDKKDKIDNFETEASKIIGTDLEWNVKESDSLHSLIEDLNSIGINNIVFDPYLVRGFDYYTGIVFEIYDKSEENNRSIFGGGRYDEILRVFGEDPVPAVGFGMGDSVIADFLDTHGLMPKTLSGPKISISVLPDAKFTVVDKLSCALREAGISVALNFETANISDAIKKAEKNESAYFCVIGSKEIDSEKFEIKELSTGNTEGFSISNPEIQKLKSFIK